MTPLDALNYLLDDTFITVVAIGVTLVASLNFIDRIGGRR